ncbi:hypothetical protein PAXRUDRAFT_823598 [Paxillus rubicundulus Ve08.2h10]|uniref:Uncharacterized protein n=1 Tax=Paxillus rubicundulus Ve08.2h10 TaxID=930991 RepID=A0A0D0E3C4_9AGAM|nr:hypothetical protein PAXRUDRAFT_823598 [Paxillus rubicundulus Ve08.2h10]
MSKVFRCSMLVYTRVLPRVRQIQAQTPSRTFHSPFVKLNSSSSPLTAPQGPTSTVSPLTAYEKQHDDSPEPRLSVSGTRTYVVSEPDPANTPYEVPSGAYSTSTPYVNSSQTTAPNPAETHSSTSSSVPHPYTTSAVPENEAGSGGNTQAPGAMGRRG